MLRRTRWAALVVVPVLAGCAASVMAAEPGAEPAATSAAGAVTAPTPSRDPEDSARSAQRGRPADAATGTATESGAAATAELPAGSGSGRRVVYSLTLQRVWLVAAADEVVTTYLVSGRPSQPDPGRYQVYSRSRHAASAVSDATMEYMVRFAHGERTGAPIGFHDIPRERDGSLEQSLADLGKPLSAGCIRQSPADAARLWAFAPVGTPVVVLA